MKYGISYVRPPGYMILLLLLSVGSLIHAQDTYELSGRIYDEATGEPLVGASVSEPATGRGVVSDESGWYILRVRTAVPEIQVSYLGYLQIDTLIDLRANSSADFHLHPTTIEYEEVRVTAESDRDFVESVQMSEIRLRQADILKLPALLGESDPVRFLQLTPGVQSGSEAGIGFYVRGGGVDQNLIMFDDAAIYNPGHLMGFLSVFNPDVINEVGLLKSGIPARYGGRLSSVVRVGSTSGRSDSLRIKGQVGFVSTRISLNRSFDRDRGSFYISARRASIDFLIKPLISPLIKTANPYFRESNYNFYDFNGGATYRIGERDYFSLSGYYGRDRYYLTRSFVLGQTDIKWGNGVAGLRWTHIFSPDLSLSTTASFTAYDFRLAGAQSNYGFGMHSNVRDLALKTRLTYLTGSHKLNGGIEITRHKFIPSRIAVDAGNFMANYADFNEMYAWEGGIYAEDEFSLSDRLTVAAGLRYSFYHHVGPYTDYIKDENSVVIDSIVYPAGESLTFYHQFEPRFSLKIQLDERSSLKVSYMHMAQYIHLATSSTVSLPSDIWMPSSKDIRPQTGEQFSLGYFRKWMNGTLETSAEAYYKPSRNQIEFIQGILPNSFKNTLEENVVTGDALSYGIEFFLRKKTGSFTGWMGYALSRSERQFDRVNEGKIYPAKFDRRHDLSLAGMYHLNELWSFSSVFIFVSGNAMTVPVGRYIIQNNLVNEYGAVNSFRMPPYHRLDLSATRTRITDKGNTSSWIFSIYNVYSRANPFYIYFEPTGNLDEYKLEVDPVMMSLFPVIPSIAWRFEF